MLFWANAKQHDKSVLCRHVVRVVLDGVCEIELINPSGSYSNKCVFAFEWSFFSTLFGGRMTATSREKKIRFILAMATTKSREQE